MFPKVQYPDNARTAKVGQRVTHKATGYRFEKSKNGRWSFVWEGAAAEHIAQAYAEGTCTMRSIAQDLGLCLSTVQRFLEKSELAGAKRLLIQRGKEVIATKQKTIKRLYLKEGMTPAMIAEHFGIALNLIVNHIREEGYQRTGSEAALLAFDSERRSGKVVNESAMRNLMARKLAGVSLATYRQSIKQMTRVVMYRFGHLVDPENSRSNANHIDHIFSVTDGWSELCKTTRLFVPRKEPIPLHIICHPANLRLLTNSQNIHKGGRSALTLKELGRAIAQFENVHGEVFSG